MIWKHLLGPTRRAMQASLPSFGRGCGENHHRRIRQILIISVRIRQTDTQVNCLENALPAAKEHFLGLNTGGF